MPANPHFMYKRRVVISRNSYAVGAAEKHTMASFAKISCTFVNCLAHCGDAAVYDLTAWKAAADGKPYWTGIGESTAYFSVCSPLEATCGASPATSPAAM